MQWYELLISENLVSCDELFEDEQELFTGVQTRILIRDESAVNPIKQNLSVIKEVVVENRTVFYQCGEIRVLWQLLNVLRRVNEPTGEDVRVNSRVRSGVDRQPLNLW